MVVSDLFKMVSKKKPSKYPSTMECLNELEYIKEYLKHKNI